MSHIDSRLGDGAVLLVTPHLPPACKRPALPSLCKTPPAHPLCAGALWRLDQGSSSVTVARQLDALNRLGQVPPGASQGETAVRALLLGAPHAERLASMPTAWVQQAGWLQKARQHLAAVPHLNRSQKEAIAFALSRTLTLWQVRLAGAAGCGKVFCLSSLSNEMVCSEWGHLSSHGWAFSLLPCISACLHSPCCPHRMNPP